MPFTEDDLLPLSALQHLVFCERQCALIHVEGLWAESAATVEGRHLHERADAGVGETRAGVRVARGLPLRSLRLGLAGRADIVELHAVGEGEAGASLPGLPGRVRPFPVEYKRGRPKRHRADLVQLCAQALCLEEMLAVEIPAGALFYGATRRRLDVTFDDRLRGETAAAAARLHEIFASGETPPPVYEPKCDQCSLIHLCLPEAPARSARRWLDHALADALAGEAGEVGEEDRS